ncbi:MAG: acyltransferase [Nitrospira sp.]|nr:acyltransferase [Nitrospira sp.]
MTTSPTSHEFFRALESLRGIAALAVVIFHVAWTFPLYDMALIRNGYLMVDLFFVLSGFVICHSYGRRLGTGRDVAKFIWIRLGRLYPLHLILLFVFLGIEIAKYIAELEYGLVANKGAFTSNNTFSFISNLLLVQALGFHDKATYNLPALSISTEFYTYILFVTALFLLRTRVAMLSMSALLILASLTLDSGGLTHNLLRCIEGFFVGVIAFHFYVALSKRPLSKTQHEWYKHGPGLLSFAGLIVFLSMKQGTGPDVLILPLFAVLIVSIAATPKGVLSTLLEVAPLAWIGKVSYSVYMVHVAVIWAFSQVLRVALKTPQAIDANGEPLLTPPPLAGALFLAAAIGVILVLSHVTYTYIEDPYRKKAKILAEKWFFPSTTRPRCPISK